MPNRLYNKQVTPKGYQKGGAVKKPKVRKIGVIGVGKAKDYPGIKEIIKLNKQGKKRFGMKRGGGVSESSKKQELASRPKRREMTKKFLKTVSSFGIPAVGGAMVAKKSIDKLRAKKKMGGSLKPVDPKTQKGLSKLPTEVRNKMGYMKKGGKVHGK